MSERMQWSCLVNKHAEIFEWEDKSGAAYLSQIPLISGYAQALLYSRFDQLSFYFHYQNQWFKFDLKRQQADFVLVQAVKNELPFELSKREIELLTLIGAGLSNAEIAEQLGISERTVAKHVENIFTKTETENRTALAVFGLTQSLCCLPTPGHLSHSILATHQIEVFANQKAKFEQETYFSIQSQTKRPIILGVPYVEQGIGQIDTKELLNGSELAVEMINRQGGINGRKIQLEKAGFSVEDKASILHAYNELFDHEVDAISTSYACYSPEIHELVAQSGIPYLHIATHSNSDKKAHNLPISQFDNIFQVCASDTNYGSGVSRFLQTYQHYYPNLLQNRIILVIRVKWQPIDIGIDKLIFDLKKEHWRVEVLDLDKKEQDFETAMKVIHQIFPSMVVLASYFAEDMVNFHHAFTQQPTNAVLYSIYAPSAFLPENQPCEGVIWSTTSGLSQNYLGQQFCQHYEQFFGYQPSYSQASIAFDQVNILANVWKQSFSTRAFKTISEGIRAMPHYGVNGTYYFGTGTQTGLTYPDNTKDLSISLPHLVYQIQQGYSKIIAPEMFANTFFKLPPWFMVK